MKFKPELLLILVFLLSLNFAAAQNEKTVDSLLSKLNNVSDDTLKVQINLHLFKEYLFVDINIAEKYLNQALELSQKNNYKKGIAISYQNIGNISDIKGDYPKATEYYLKSLEINKELNNKENISDCYINLGTIKAYQGNYSESIEYFSNSLKIYEELNQKKGIAQCLNNIGIVYRMQGNYSKSINYYEKALKIKQEINDKPGVSSSLNNIGVVYENQGNYPKAIEYYEKSLKIDEELGDERGISISLNNIGDIYIRIKKFKEAIGNIEKALEIGKKNNDKSGIAWSVYLLGVAKMGQESYPKALVYLEKALVLHEELGEEGEVVSDLIKIGISWYELGNYSKGKQYSLKGLKHAQLIGAKDNIRFASEILSKIFVAQQNFEMAYKYHVLFKETHDSIFTMESKKTVSSMETRFELERKEQELTLERTENEKKDAQIEQQRTQQRALMGGLILITVIFLLIIIGYLRIRKANKVITSQKHEIQEANEELNQINEELNTTLEKVGEQMDEITIQRDNIEKQKNELKKLSIVADKTDNSVMIIGATGEIEWVNEGFSRMLGVSFEEFSMNYGTNIYKISLNSEIEKVIAKSVENKESVVYSNKTVTKKGKEIWIQTTLTPIFGSDNQLYKLIAIDSDITKIKNAEQEVTKHRDELHFKNKHITESINYANRIQTAVLPSKELAEMILPEHFIFFKPRDIVSGDFYWMQIIDDNILIAAADCTGHGVPGAFLSMLGISFLNEIVMRKEITHANQVLEELRNKIKTTLGQTGKENEAKDGMDIAFSIINTKTKKLQFAGAYNPLYLIRNKNNSDISRNSNLTLSPKDYKSIENETFRLNQIKANPQPIGVFVKEKPFVNREIQLIEGDKLYMFSDGYMDQTGGSENKKFMSRNFKNLLLSISEKPMNEQKQILVKTFNHWKANNKQIDDVVVIGIGI